VPIYTSQQRDWKTNGVSSRLIGVRRLLIALPRKQE
jgi:hypothetical protein